jgi:bifunctional non-homologous end joining protein LigD
LALRDYRRKRRFEKTPEPRGASRRAGGGAARFVVQKHRARRLHYDLRLELGGVLASWAVPKGPSLDPAARRLAVRVEDHPLEYESFEGVIPEGEYGAGEVIVWDRGTWTWNPPPPGRRRAPRGPAEALERGKLDFTLAGEKLRGRFVLAKAGGREAGENDWLLIKVRDEHAEPAGDILVERPESVITGRRIEELRRGAPGEARWHSGRGPEGPARRPPLDIPKLLGRDARAAKKAPPPARVRPMLPALVASAPEEAGWLFELKLDGVRAIARKEGRAVHIVSRSGNPLERRFPEIVRALARLPVERCVLDGELCVHDAGGRTRFQRIQPRIHAASEVAVERLAREASATFYVFDALHAGGLDLRAVPLAGRKRVAAALVGSEGEPLRFVTHVEGRGPELFALACERGLEGVVAKRARAPYVEGRTRLWRKVKCGARAHFVIGGFTEHETTRRGAIGGLLLGLYRGEELVPVGGVGTGFDAKTRRALHARLARLARKTSPFAGGAAGGLWRSGRRPERIVWVAPRLCCECRYAEFTADGKVRHPSFLRLAERDPKTCTFPEDARLEAEKARPPAVPAPGSGGAASRPVPRRPRRPRRPGSPTSTRSSGPRTRSQGARSRRTGPTTPGEA